MTAAELVETLRARGVTLEPRGDKLRLAPASAVTPEEVEALRLHKAEVLVLLTAPPPFLPLLDRETVREVLGPHADDPHAVACLAWDVRDELRAVEREIGSGVIAARPRLVRNRPLADWLDLDELARLLRLWRDRHGVGP
jgi:hypothetical protein